MTLQEIADYYGEESQLDILQEELAELIQAISKYKRSGFTVDLEEEIADVEIMIEQIKYLLNLDLNYIDIIRREKLARQEERIRDEQVRKSDR